MQWVEFSQNNYILVLGGNTWKVMKGSSSRYPYCLSLVQQAPSSLSLLRFCLLFAAGLFFRINRFGSSEYLGLLELTSHLVDWILDGSWQKF